MTHWMIFRVDAEHREELQREAEQRRLIHQAVAGDRHPNRHRYRFLLAHLGRSMVKVGERLQTAYGAPANIRRRQST